MKKFSLLGKGWKRDFFYRLEKIIQPPPPPKKKIPPYKKSSLVQSPVLIFQLADKNAPIRTKRVRSHKSPWITVDLKKLMHSRVIMNIKAINSNDPHDWARFKRMRNKVNVTIRQAKELFLPK